MGSKKRSEVETAFTCLRLSYARYANGFEVYHFAPADIATLLRAHEKQGEQIQKLKAIVEERETDLLNIQRRHNGKEPLPYPQCEKLRIRCKEQQTAIALKNGRIAELSSQMFDTGDGGVKVSREFVQAVFTLKNGRIAALEAERDEARAEVTRLKQIIDDMDDEEDMDGQQ